VVGDGERNDIIGVGEVRSTDYARHQTNSARAPMKLPHRRQFLHLAAGAAALPAASGFASAQTYPAQPVRLIVAAAAGGDNDITARLMGQVLSERLGQPFVIENRPGAGGNIGTEAVVRAPPDGYTLLLVSSGNATSAALYDKLTFDFMRDIAPVAGIMRVPEIMALNPSVPAKTVPEFIAYSKTNPGKIKMGSGGIGSPAHLAGEMFKMMSGAEMVHVPYRGMALALQDLLAGQVQVVFGSIPSMIGYVRAGALRALGVTTTTRSEMLHEIPTVSEWVPGYDADQWYGIGVPSKTPIDIIEKLNKEINAALADPKIRAPLADLGGTVFPSSPAEFRQFIADETAKWGKVVKFAGIKPQ
jgi:tripartite-type tricarboxylate transporter receptor subunit TctC